MDNSLNITTYAIYKNQAEINFNNIIHLLKFQSPPDDEKALQLIDSLLEGKDKIVNQLTDITKNMNEKPI